MSGPDDLAVPVARGRSVVRVLLVLVAAVAVADVLVGWLHPMPTRLIVPRATVPSQVVALGRLGLAAAAVVVLLWGPGLVLRARVPRWTAMPLGYVPLPGIALLAATGGLTWATSGALDPHVLVRWVLGPVLIALLVALWFQRSALLDPDEWHVALVTAAVFGVALGRTLWPRGPLGELYGGTISRTLEVGDRSDSRISYHVTSLVAHHLDPSSPAGQALFSPYAFSDRGPLAGLAAAPMMLLSGTTPTLGLPSQTWQPFDPQGFMVYRLVMMLLALTALPAVYTLVRSVTEARTAVFAVVVVGGTPFFVHDVYFTWPKWAAAALCLLAVHQVVGRRPLTAGVLLGVGYLFHPLALLSGPAFVLLLVLVAWRERDPGAALRGAASTIVRAGVGLAVVAGIWRLSVRGNPSRGNFLHYFRQAGTRPETLHNWLVDRYESVANTLVPLRLPLAESTNPAINAAGTRSSAVIHFFFQYWTGLPLGAGIAFYPVLLVGLAVLARRHPWIFVAAVAVPFVFFAVYWGDFNTGLLREGLHTWMLTVLAAWAVVAAPALRRPWVRQLLTAVLLLRLADVAAMLVVPTLATAHQVLPPPVMTPIARHTLHDPLVGKIAYLLMALGLLALAVLTLRIVRRTVDVHRPADSVFPVRDAARHRPGGRVPRGHARLTVWTERAT